MTPQIQDARALVRSVLGLDRPERDVDFPCPEQDFIPGLPSGDCWTDGHYMCRECENASPTSIAERDQQ